MTQPPQENQQDGDRSANGQAKPQDDEAGKDHSASEPADDLVTTEHSIEVDGADGISIELKYSVTTGRMVLRREGHTDDKFDGPQAEGGGVRYRLYRRVGRPGGAARHLRVQRRARFLQRVAAPGAARPAPGRDGRRGRTAAAAVRPGRQSADPAAVQRPGVHRPGVDRVLPRGQGREVEGLPRLRRRYRVRRRGHQALDDPQRPVDVTQVPVRRVLRDDQGPGLARTCRSGTACTSTA